MRGLRERDPGPRYWPARGTPDPGTGLREGPRYRPRRGSDGVSLRGVNAGPGGPGWGGCAAGGAGLV